MGFHCLCHDSCFNGHEYMAILVGEKVAVHLVLVCASCTIRALHNVAVPTVIVINSHMGPANESIWFETRLLLYLVAVFSKDGPVESLEAKMGRETHLLENGIM